MPPDSFAEPLLPGFRLKLREVPLKLGEVRLKLGEGERESRGSFLPRWRL